MNNIKQAGLKGISFDEIKQLMESDSIYDDIIISDKFTPKPPFDMFPARIEGVLFAFCMQGDAYIHLGLDSYTINRGECLVIFPEQLIQAEKVSDDFNGLIFIFSMTYLSQLRIDIQRLLPLFVSVKNNPICQLSEEEGIALVDYFMMIKKKMKLKNHPDQLKIIQNILEAVFLEIGYIYRRNQGKRIKLSTRKEVLFNQFIHELTIHYKEERSVSYYANKLCITSKYLSSLVKEISDKTPAELIINCVMFESKTLLKSTDMSIQQVSDLLNFPNQSFFGKYFKRYAGISPSQYKQS